MIISIGFRVNSKTAIKFRTWANKLIKEYVSLLKGFDKVKDWLSYDLKFDEFEVALRGYLRAKIITEYDYKKLCAKYGWLYD